MPIKACGRSKTDRAVKHDGKAEDSAKAGDQSQEKKCDRRNNKRREFLRLQIEKKRHSPCRNSGNHDDHHSVDQPFHTGTHVLLGQVDAVW